MPTATAEPPETGAVRAMFDRIAPRYDFLNHVLSAGLDIAWRRQAIRAMDGIGPGVWLDLCTGTGDLLIAGLRHQPRARVIGVDLAHGMLTRTAFKARRHGLADRVKLIEADATRLPFANASFDGITMAFGIRNIGAAAEALSEMKRAARTGAAVVILEFSMPDAWWGGCYRFYFSRILPRLGRLISGHSSAYAYLPASVQRFPRAEVFEDHLRAAGFRDVGSRPLTGGIVRLYRGIA
ncbi:MAG: bifunctional demethylmenaquinone methyltransferase/2-methoxy-6-polyprenyl-1,4-benzoquinol methylase UbiE [Vicinamibacteria bacterium]|jgi:demethylmenaquinone methyltransferase/2-methoxy-6-polyprenyl-1,4-benzoquinol methylase|nr:bifunctional demethylmenaquinone methyltransferase/2-methoxy-6-polyprenyl-1,4-benzoquinol methylase UbiE [Vicinamibacteria bacterium]